MRTPLRCQEVSSRRENHPSSQPSRLILLCVVQGCERFAFFAALPLLVLYLHQHMGFTEHGALLILGIFLALSYLGALPGGVLVDRSLGCSLGTLLGGVLLMLGYGGLALDRPALLWPSLGLLLSGHALFKPGLSALAGALYIEGDARRERGFLLLHFAVNVGAVLGPLGGEWARSHRGWPTLFYFATLGMLSAVVVTALGFRQSRTQTQSAARHQPVGLAPAVKQARVRALWLLCAVSIIFFLTAQQAGSSLSLFAEAHTELNLSALGQKFILGPGHFAALHALFVLLLTPILLGGFSALRRHNAEPSAFAKMAWGYLATAAAFAVMSAAGLRGGDSGRVSPLWLIGCYVLLSIAELLIPPIGLSLVTQLAPPGMTSRWVGLWLVSIAVGHAIAGALGLLWGRWPNHRYFALLAAVALGSSFLLIARLRRLESTLNT